MFEGDFRKMSDSDSGSNDDENKSNNVSPAASPATNHAASSAASPVATPSASPAASPGASPAGSPTVSPAGSPAASPAGAPAASSAATPAKFVFYPYGDFSCCCRVEFYHFTRFRHSSSDGESDSTPSHRSNHDENSQHMLSDKGGLLGFSRSLEVF